MKRFVSVLLVLVICITSLPFTVSAQRDFSKHEILAQQLKDLGLFSGVSETDFDLERAPTRVEAIVMLIRVLGKETEVTKKHWVHPFTDVPDWADNYIGYAFKNGLTDGQSQTTFGTGDASAAMYLTFVLRALGYSDTDGKDFTWDNPFDLARKTGILTNEVNTNNFLRADVVLVSHAALSSYLKDSLQPLWQRLVEANVFTKSRFSSVYNSHKRVPFTPTKITAELTAEQIYEKCSPAIFYIETYDPSNRHTGNGSGFFIDDQGTAVTNYHVIENAYNSKIQLPNNDKFLEILGVYDYNVEQDWAVIKVDCTGNPYLTIADCSKVVGGMKTYAIGSPKGLQNTISQGIVSNPKRDIGRAVTYIQTDTPISPGSSGGALLNKYGEVVGITSAFFNNGQNLNLVVPMTYLSSYRISNVSALKSIFFGITPDGKYVGNSTPNLIPTDPVTEALKQLLIKNGYNVADAYCLNYSITARPDGTCYYNSIDYSTKANVIFLRSSLYKNDSETEIFRAFLSIDTKEEKYNYVCTYLPSTASPDKAETKIDPATFEKQTKLEYENVVITMISEDVFFDLCDETAQNIVSFFEDILTQDVGGFSVKDFGFNNF